MILSYRWCFIYVICIYLCVLRYKQEFRITWCSSRLTVKRLASRMELEHEYIRTRFCAVYFPQSLGFCVVYYCLSLSFFFSSLFCSSIFDLLLLGTSLVSTSFSIMCSNMAYQMRSTEGGSSNRDQARCSQYNIIWYSLSVTCNRSLVFSG